jgi:hypothetical protein
LHIESALVFIIELEVAVFREDWLLILLQAELRALVDDRMKEVVLFVATANKLITLTVVDVKEIVSILTGILHQLRGEWPESKG